MSDLIGEWCAYHHNLNNIGHDRRVMQLRVLRQFEAIIPSGDVRDADATDLERYMAKMIADGYHPHTVLRDLRMIRPFLRHMRRRGMIDAERWLRLLEVKAPRGAYSGQPRPYTLHEMRRFWVDLDRRYPWTKDKDVSLRTPARGEYWVRRWAAGYSRWLRVYPYATRLQIEAVVALALYGGLRRNEIYYLPLSEFDYVAEYLRTSSIKGPDGTPRERIVPFTREMSLAIGNWIEFRNTVLSPEHDFPWLCLYAPVSATKPMSKYQFDRLLSKVGEGYGLHRLRHTMATERYRAGMPLDILQHVLGHANISQTQGYAQISEERIIEVARKTDQRFAAALRRTA